MNKKEILQEIIKNNDLDSLYEITKIVAETDSIGESYNYCAKYSQERFDSEVERVLNNDESEYYSYLSSAGISIYNVFNKKIRHNG